MRLAGGMETEGCSRSHLFFGTSRWEFFFGGGEFLLNQILDQPPQVELPIKTNKLLSRFPLRLRHPARKNKKNASELQVFFHRMSEFPTCQAPCQLIYGV